MTDRNLYLSTQKIATQALLKFSIDHDYPAEGLFPVQACLSALEAGDIDFAVSAYQQVPLGGIGSFGDRWPSVVFEHEDQNYVNAVFTALVNWWSSLMRVSL